MFPAATRCADTNLLILGSIKQEANRGIIACDESLPENCQNLRALG